MQQPELGFWLPRGLCEHVNPFDPGLLVVKYKWKEEAQLDVLVDNDMGGLGFRDLELFNLAQLACQAWRLLTDPSSLSARILQAVYFPHSTILETELGSNPSQVWRAIIDDRDVLRQGLIRSISNGLTSNISDYNWIPGEPLLHHPYPWSRTRLSWYTSLRTSMKLHGMQIWSDGFFFQWTLMQY